MDTDSLSGDEMQGSLLYRWGDMIMGRDPVLIRFVPEATSAAESENFANGSQAAETTPAPGKVRLQPGDADKSGCTHAGAYSAGCHSGDPCNYSDFSDCESVQSPEQTPSPPQGTQVENEKILLIFSSLPLENVI